MSTNPLLKSHLEQSEQGEEGSVSFSNVTPAVQNAISAVIDQKGIDPVAIHFGKRSPVADTFIIASGTSNRHIAGIADKVVEALSEQGEKLLNSSGLNGSDWIILDYGDLLVHIFTEEMRHYYEFDELWRDYPKVQLEGELYERARKLRTGMIA
jgi:ribosome-associated protein